MKNKDSFDLVLTLCVKGILSIILIYVLISCHA
jgi:hypothetical protein